MVTKPKSPRRIFAEELCGNNIKETDWGVAKMLYASKHKKEFRNFDDARTMVRNIRGHHGKGNLDNLADKTLTTPPRLKNRRKPAYYSIDARELLYYSAPTLSDNI